MPNSKDMNTDLINDLNDVCDFEDTVTWSKETIEVTNFYNRLRTVID